MGPSAKVRVSWSIAFMCVGVAAWLFWSARRGNVQLPDVAAERSNTTEQGEATPSSRGETAPLEPPMPGAAMEGEPAQPSAVKARANGLAAGQLPAPRYFDSKPRFSHRADIERGLNARASRAATLDRRLESRIAQLHSDAETADPNRRAALERDLALLEAQLRARQRWETARDQAARPSRGVR